MRLSLRAPRRVPQRHRRWVPTYVAPTPEPETPAATTPTGSGIRRRPAVYRPYKVSRRATIRFRYYVTATTTVRFPTRTAARTVTHQAHTVTRCRRHLTLTAKFATRTTATGTKHHTAESRAWVDEQNRLIEQQLVRIAAMDAAARL